jgi:hypothetical protein
MNDKVELNFFYLHIHDAEKFCDLAEKETSKLKSFYSRHAILSVVYAMEALINRVLDDFLLPSLSTKNIEKLSTYDKWMIAPFVCGKEIPVNTPFDKSREPFQSLKELIRIRNWLVHPKPGEYLEARKRDDMILMAQTEHEIPWVDTLQGDQWPQTGIPLNPFEIDENSAQKALDTLNSIVAELLSVFHELIDKEWLEELNLETKNGETEKISIDSLWGGYTPNEANG